LALCENTQPTDDTQAIPFQQFVPQYYLLNETRTSCWLQLLCCDWWLLRIGYDEKEHSCTQKSKPNVFWTI